MRLVRITLLFAALLAVAGNSAVPALAEVTAPPIPAPRVNAPYLPGEPRYGESAIFWFGKHNRNDNSVDTRVGYNDAGIWVRLSIIDHSLWYDPQPAADRLTGWDSAVLYLKLSGNTGDLGADTYRFVSQINNFEPRDRWQASYEGSAAGWVRKPMTFYTSRGWRGPAPNSGQPGSGWVTTFHIPFASLGLPGRPADGTTWGMAVTVHDRDDQAGADLRAVNWPPRLTSEDAATWSQLGFGPRIYERPLASEVETQVVRHGLGGAVVTDGAVGGGLNCGAGLDFMAGWGEKNYAGMDRYLVANEMDISDWPCFSKVYLTFPLPRPPAGKALLSARLKMYQNGNFGDASAPVSLVQVLTVNEDWQENTLTWNNAPLAGENLGYTAVPPVDVWPGFPGVPHEWDVSWAVADAVRRGQPVRLALYSADEGYDTGRYFNSSDMGNWNANGRPTLTLQWGSPVSSHRFVWLPALSD
jgi:hypothetical protein